MKQKRPETLYQEELHKIVKKVIDSYKPEKIIVFGSAVRGRLKPYSDIDLFVIKDTKEKYLDRLRKLALILDTDYPTDIFVYTPQELDKAISENRFFIVDEV